ncbi:bifunctional adenosylcobinamide kinase/adenosylcobinamide-phosphate guanylyltransferase [Mycoplasma sp. P36-A1]|uniref:bifunctional adenosylcobinamide kinase/adenosylcobinamide-phosphate guanylyltransferase n=1 Tax=Mycoplasma sp. P36-A1 TaxID=3252900 RepID=UPI003C2F5A88
MNTLITGGARSGKSAFAESLLANNNDVTYISSYVIDENDEEMIDRIKRHKQQRNSNWGLIESNTTLDAINTKDILFDCLAIFTSNVLYKYSKDLEKIDGQLFDTMLNHLKKEIDKLLDNNENIIIVTNEVGLSTTPFNHVERIYRDLLGKINVYTASRVDNVYFVVCGIPQKIK